MCGASRVCDARCTHERLDRLLLADWFRSRCGCAPMPNFTS
jgi:hypothetical protein